MPKYAGITLNALLCRAFVSFTNANLSIPTIARNIQKIISQLSEKGVRYCTCGYIVLIQMNSASGEVRMGSGRTRYWKKLLKDSHRAVSVRRNWSRPQRCGTQRKTSMSTSSCSVGEVELVDRNAHIRFLDYILSYCPSSLKRGEVIH